MYRDINTVIDENNKEAQKMPCELAAENDRLKQKLAAMCKERDELKSLKNQLLGYIRDYEECDQCVHGDEPATGETCSRCVRSACAEDTSEDLWEWKGIEKLIEGAR